MTEQHRAVTHPPCTKVDVMCGTRKVEIRPWTMAQRADLRPRVADVIERVLQLQVNPQSVDLAQLFMHAEDEVAEIVRASVTLPEDLTWDELLWEDLPTLAQAVWETSLLRADGGGLAGKVMGVLGGALQNEAIQEILSAPPKPITTSSRPSPSSPDGGAPTQNA